MPRFFQPTRIAFAVAALALPLTATANQSLNTAGYSGTVGGTINEGSLHSSSFNPAGNNLLLHKDDKFRFGYLSNFGGYVELGESEDLDKKVDGLIDDLDSADNFNSGGKAQLEQRYPTVAANNGTEADYFEAIAKRANEEVIVDLEKGGQFRTGAQLQAPLMPFLFRSTVASGTFSLNASLSLQAKGEFIGDTFGVRTSFGNGIGNLDLDLDAISQSYNDIKSITDKGVINNNDINAIKTALNNSGILVGDNATTVENLVKEQQIAAANGQSFRPQVENSLTTHSGLDVHAARIAHLALGYGTNLSHLLDLDRTYGQLEAGLRFNLYNVEMGRKFISLQAEANNDNNESTKDNLTQDFLDNTNTSTNLGVDLGFLWHSNNYQAGITFYNLNEPSFDYPDLSDFLDKNDDTYKAVAGLEAIGKAKMMDSVTLTRHAVVEAAVYSDSRNWMLQGAYTLGTATNFVGDEFQNLHISTGYFPKTAWLPGLRAGYSKNMTGTELTKIHAGATFFGVMHLDVAVATDQSSFDGEEVPRYAAISLGFEEKF